MAKNIPSIIILIFLAINSSSCAKTEAIPDLKKELVGKWDIHQKDNTQEYQYLFFNTGMVIKNRSDISNVKINETIREEGNFKLENENLMMEFKAKIILKEKDTKTITKTPLGWTYDTEETIAETENLRILAKNYSNNGTDSFLIIEGKTYKKLSDDPFEP